MNKKVIIPIFVILLLALAGTVVYLTASLKEQKAANEEMQELAELDKKEMENEYQRFADQYLRSMIFLFQSIRESLQLSQVQTEAEKAFS